MSGGCPHLEFALVDWRRTAAFFSIVRSDLVKIKEP